MMRWSFLLAWMVGIALNGLSQAGVAEPVKPPIAQEILAGCYAKLNETGNQVLVLRLNPDFSYFAVSHHDGGVWSEASGHWRLSANVVVLVPDRETFQLVRSLSRLSLRRIGGQYSLRLLEMNEWAKWISGSLDSSPCGPSRWGRSLNTAQAPSRSSQFNEEKLAVTLRETRAAAERGDAHAMSKLAEMYAFGRGGVEHDGIAAVDWYRKAADQGLAEAAYRIGVMCRDGESVAKDAGEAVLWFRKAAEQGDASGQNALGVMYRDGEGVARDAGEAVLWFRKAAEQGDSHGQYNLAGMYLVGHGVIRDDAQALEWFNKAGGQLSGFDGPNEFGTKWEVGRLRDREELRRWQEAVNRESGDAQSEVRLGELYKK